MLQALVISLSNGRCLHFEDFTASTHGTSANDERGSALAMRFYKLNQKVIESTQPEDGAAEKTSRPSSGASLALKGEGVFMQQPPSGGGGDGLRTKRTSSRFSTAEAAAALGAIRPDVVLQSLRADGAAWFFAGDADTSVMVALSLADDAWDDASGEQATRFFRDSVCIKFRQQLQRMASSYNMTGEGGAGATSHLVTAGSGRMNPSSGMATSNLFGGRYPTQGASVSAMGSSAGRAAAAAAAAATQAPVAPLHGMRLMLAALGLRLLASTVSTLLDGLVSASWRPVWLFAADTTAFMKSATAAAAAEKAAAVVAPPPPTATPASGLRHPTTRSHKQAANHRRGGSRLTSFLGLCMRPFAAEEEENVDEASSSSNAGGRGSSSAVRKRGSMPAQGGAPHPLSPPSPPSSSMGPLQHLLHADGTPRGTAAGGRDAGSDEAVQPQWTHAAVRAALEVVQQVSLATVAIMTMERDEDDGVPPCIDALDMQLAHATQLASSSSDGGGGSSGSGASRLLVVRQRHAVVVTVVPCQGAATGACAAAMRASLLQPLERLSQLFQFLSQVATAEELQGFIHQELVL